MKLVLIVFLLICLHGASWMIALGVAVFNTYLEDKVKERRKK